MSVRSEQEVEALVIATAALSKANKRKVGAILTVKLPNGKGYSVLSHGHNYNPHDIGGQCEDSEGKTLSQVVHAEDSCLQRANKLDLDKKDLIMFVSHEPCDNCKELLISNNVLECRVVKKFLKFDEDKADPRIPVEVLVSLANLSESDKTIVGSAIVNGLVPITLVHAVNEVLIHGAKKYKPNNWKEVDDPERYVKALLRHLYAYLGGEVDDRDSGMPHMWHVATNVAFLIELSYVSEPKPSLKRI